MGFMDKAKQLAEQAQAKLDEAQQQLNKDQGPGQHSGPTVEYDEHGRPVAQAPEASRVPPHGDPLAPEPSPAAPATPGVPPTGLHDRTAAPPSPPPVASPGVPPTAAQDAPTPDAPPARPEPDAADEDRNRPSFAPPKLSSGDPLAG